MKKKPLAIDLFCGLGGWTEGLLAEGYDVVGFDIERHVYGKHRYPGLLVIQDVLTLHGSQFKDVALIVASPPCQEYSYMAMPWKRAKAKAAAIRADATGAELERLNRLFNACMRIQFEASLAAGRCVPLIIENVKGAQPWVGRARWNFGSFYLWGDVPALMPKAFRVSKVPGLSWSGSDKPGYVGRGFNVTADQRLRTEGIKDKPYETGNKNNGGSWFAIAHNKTSGHGQNPDGRKSSGIPHIRDGEPHTRHLTNPGEHSGIKQHGSGAAWWDKALDERRREATATKVGGGREGWFGGNTSPMRRHHSGSSSRKAASAMIAKIPLPLSRHIAAIFRSSNVAS